MYDSNCTGIICKTRKRLHLLPNMGASASSSRSVNSSSSRGSRKSGSSRGSGSPTRREQASDDMLEHAQFQAESTVHRFISKIRYASDHDYGKCCEALTSCSQDQHGALLPISQIISTNTYFYHVGPSERPTDIEQTIDMCVNQFASKPSTNAMRNGTEKVLTTMLAESPCEQQGDTL